MEKTRCVVASRKTFRGSFKSVLAVTLSVVHVCLLNCFLSVRYAALFFSYMYFMVACRAVLLSLHCNAGRHWFKLIHENVCLPLKHPLCACCEAKLLCLQMLYFKPKCKHIWLFERRFLLFFCCEAVSAKKPYIANKLCSLFESNYVSSVALKLNVTFISGIASIRVYIYFNVMWPLINVQYNGRYPGLYAIVTNHDYADLVT